MTLLDDIRRPFNLLSTVIAVVSLALSIYFYFEAQQKREPYYIVKETSQIFNTANATPNLRLIDKNGNRINGDVHLLEVSFWNGGRQTIESHDARTPIYLELPVDTRIIDFSISKENKPDISRFKLSPAVGDQAEPQKLFIEWQHLDPGLGAKIQVIYVGQRNPKLIFGGDILDSEIRDGSSLANRLLGSALSTLVAAVLGALVSQVVGYAVKRVPASLPQWRRRLTKIIVAAILYGPMAVLLWLLFTGKSSPV
jgi:ABC-type dipeptide/oligopeptide/nickel transport system permease subunit